MTRSENKEKSCAVEKRASQSPLREEAFYRKSSRWACAFALAAMELAFVVAACIYGAHALPRHSFTAAAIYVAFCAIGCGVVALLWYVFVLRRPLLWGRRATPRRLAAVVGLSAVVAVLLEWGTLAGAPLSDPSVLSDWHLSRIAAFFAVSVPFLCCAVMYDWRALGARIAAIALADHAAWAKRVCGYAASAFVAGVVCALVAGAVSEYFAVGNPNACRLFAGVVAALIVVLVGLRRSMAARPERALFAIVLASGFLFSTLTPWYTHVSWDDHIHYDRAVATSYLIDPEYTSGDAALVGKAFHDVAYFSRYHNDPGWVNAYDASRLEGRYHQLDELGNAGKREKPAPPLAPPDAFSGAHNDNEQPGEGAGQPDISNEQPDANAEQPDGSAGQPGGSLLPLGARPDFSALSDLGKRGPLFDSDTPQAVRLDGAVTLRGVSIVEYYTVAYIPAAIGLWTARLVGLPTSVAFFMGRLFSLVCYAFVVYFACKRLKSGKMILGVCALIPTMVYLASNYSYDAWLSGFLMLGFAYFAGEMQRPDEPLTWRRFLLMVGAFLVGLGPKAVYVPIAALLLFMPRAKFASLKGACAGMRVGKPAAAGCGDIADACKVVDAGMAATDTAAANGAALANEASAANGRRTCALTHGRYLAVVFASALFVLATFVLPLLFAGPGEGDARGGDVNPAVQIAFIVGQPFAYLEVFAKFCQYYFTVGNLPFILTDFCGVETSSYAYAVAVLLLVVALVDRRACDMHLATHAKRIAMFVLFTLTFFLICTALFISFTPAGWDWIEGVQGRYLLPLLFPFGLICLNFRPFCALGERLQATDVRRAVYHCTVLALGGFFVLASIAETIVFNA